MSSSTTLNGYSTSNFNELCQQNSFNNHAACTIRKNKNGDDDVLMDSIPDTKKTLPPIYESKVSDELAPSKVMLYQKYSENFKSCY